MLGVHDRSPSDITYISHGTTGATNAMLERDGSKTGLVTTVGFRGAPLRDAS
jgi:N-methylhydantoinase A